MGVIGEYCSASSNDLPTLCFQYISCTPSEHAWVSTKARATLSMIYNVLPNWIFILAWPVKGQQKTLVDRQYTGTIQKWAEANACCFGYYPRWCLTLIMHAYMCMPTTLLQWWTTLVSEGLGSIFKRADGRYFIYLPKNLVEDTGFPFPPKSSVKVRIHFKPGDKKITVEKP